MGKNRPLRKPGTEHGMEQEKNNRMEYGTEHGMELGTDVLNFSERTPSNFL